MTEHLSRNLLGSEILDSSGTRVGKIESIFLSTTTQQPEWAIVRMGIFGQRAHFVPLLDARVDTAGDVHVSITKDAVKDSPEYPDNRTPAPAESAALYRHYGIVPDAAVPEPAPAVPVDPAVPGPREGMTRSEEQLRVGTETVETGTVGLTKKVVTEEHNVTIPVSHEEVTVERQPITPGEPVHPDDAALSDDVQEVTLHAERPVVSKETVPVENVSLNPTTVTEEHTISEPVSHEEVQVDGPDKGKHLI